jgi:DNA topoisomerase-3
LGWREVYEDLKEEKVDEAEAKELKKEPKETEEKILPIFEKGESGIHTPEIHKGKTSPPKYYTEATLLRAMETAGKLVENEEMRELMKENGIGRPSTRANIIETLFKRKYIEKKKKNLIATETGMNLIDTIKSDLLKSPELTGQWEHKLRLIEKGKYDPQTFKIELFKMVRELWGGLRSQNLGSLLLYGPS